MTEQFCQRQADRVPSAGPGGAAEMLAMHEVRRVGHDKIEHRGRVVLQATPRYADFFRPGGCQRIFFCLSGGGFVQLQSDDVYRGITALGQHQGHQARAGADVQNTASRTQWRPGAEQNTVGAHLHGTTVVIDVKLLESKTTAAHADPVRFFCASSPIIPAFYRLTRPIMSSMTFEQLELDPILVRALAGMGYAKPTTIQSQVIPEAMSGRDIMASAPTGTGKTAAFLLPICQHLLDFPRRQPGPARILILTPTRELAIQIAGDARKMLKDTPLRVEVITGGVHESQHLPALTKTTDIVVATPGRLLQYMDEESFDSRDIEMLVLDEADRMLDMGFIKDVDRIAAEARWRRQTMLFSATLEGRGLMKFAADLLKNPVEVSAEPPRSERKKINQWVHLADNPEHKFALLVHLLRQPDVTRSIIFVKTRDRLMELASRLQQEGLHNAWLRGEMEQEKRIEALGRFRIGRVNILVATDVASRGIDLPEVSHVINYDMPRTADVYVHRIGRTGRAGQKGTAISLVEAHDMPLLVRVEKYTEEVLKRRIIDELRPKHKEARVASRKKKDGDSKGKKALLPKKKEKVRLRDTKAKGKPKWAGAKPDATKKPASAKKAAGKKVEGNKDAE